MNLSDETKTELRKLAEQFGGYASVAEEWRENVSIFAGRRRAVLSERAFIFRMVEAMLLGRANGEYDDDYEPVED